MPQMLWDLIRSDGLALPEIAGDDWGDQAIMDAAMAEARRIVYPYALSAVIDSSVEELLPELRDQVPGEDAAPVLLTQCCSRSVAHVVLLTQFVDVYHPDGISSPYSLAVSHVDLDAGDAGSEVTATGLLSNGWEVYASLDNLYVTQTSGWWWGWSDSTLQTTVHKFQLAGADTVYVGSGVVDG